MNIIERIKHVIGGGSLLTRDQVSRFDSLPRDQARREFCDALYAICVNRSTDFVKRELGRGDSPYQGVSAAAFYHEILIVTFWLMDKAAADGAKAFLHELQERYFQSYSAPGSREERQKALAGKYEQYEDFWNEITGHFDEFGLCVVKNLFGISESSRTRERTFWIIQYADESVRLFSPFKKTSKKFFSQP